MRVALIVPGFSASDEDWCIPAMLTLVRRLTPSLDLEIFALRYPPERRRYEVAGARVHALGGAGARRWRKPALVARAVREVAAAHRQRPFDVVHAMWADEPGVAAVAAAAWLGRRAVVSIMGGELVHLADVGYGVQAGRLGRVAVARALRHAAVVTAGSKSLAALVPPGPARRLRVLPIGVDVDRFSPRGERADLAGSFRILHVGSLTPVKDQATLLAAMRDVAAAASPAHLHVVGGGPLGPDLRRRAAALGLEGHVTFHGAVAHDRLPAFYRAADLCVLSSRFESQSLVALEAAACGTPLVGTAVGLLPDLQVPVVAAGDVAGLAREILRMASSGPDLRASFGPALRARVEREFDVDRTVADLLAIYAGLSGPYSAIEGPAGA